MLLQQLMALELMKSIAKQWKVRGFYGNSICTEWLYEGIACTSREHTGDHVGRSTYGHRRCYRTIRMPFCSSPK